ncbi:Dps family protein [Microbacterium sp. NC79]|uniref:Dps family protein n=1 Tax=Microbacterium sp. NC79 TaxID=2851009 RepID=UPI001C2B850A|nr:DNA starvation/stationary phase protection protein [Microbacterium sp. NC79]MBV0894743.1 DNA starvation/stationary phase protection protein [Microbacterium sp. NC79]
MTTSKTIATTASDPTVAAGSAQFLTPLVHSLQALVLNGKQAHWHVRGANFVGVHELLDTVVAHAMEWADTAAERIVSLGLPVDARASVVAAEAGETAVPAAFANSVDMIHAVVADIDVILAQTQEAIDGLDEVDLTSQDVAIEIRRGLEKDRWFLTAHVAA